MRSVLVAAAAVLACSCSCQKDQPAPAPPPPGSPVDRPKIEAAEKAVAQADFDFAFELYRALAATPGNVVVAPWGVSSALGMTLAGAKGDTAQELQKVMHFGPDSHLGFQWLQRTLLSPGRPGVRFSLANRLFVKQGMPVLPPFAAIALEDYGAPLEGIDFSKPDEARAHVNQWVDAQTQHRVTELLPAGAITPDSRLVLANALSLKGSWRTAFDPARTFPRDFTLPDGTSVSVPTMSHPSVRGRYADLGEAQVLELPFRGDGLVLDVVLPAAGVGLAALEQGLDGAKYAGWVTRLVLKDLDVALPRFQVSQSIDLATVLRGLGVRAAFTPGTADFSLINETVPLALSSAVHRSSLEVTEEGAEATAGSAATVDEVKKAAARPRFEANRPFLFAVRDLKTGVVLFVGRVTDPR